MNESANSANYYYNSLFPAESICNLMTARCFDRPEAREFACELDVDGATIWKRYESCKSPTELRAFVTKPQFRALHIGPTFSEAASCARRPGVVVRGKELVFDLDLQDVAWFDVDKSNQVANDRYVRATFASCAVLVEVLREIMGFEHFVPVYSGRRGVHLWVLDERCLHWSDAERGALCSFIAGVPSKKDAEVIMTQHIRGNPSFGPMAWAAVKKAEQVLFAPFSDGGVGLLDRVKDVKAFVEKLFNVDVDAKFQGAKKRTRATVDRSVVGRTDRAAFTAIRDSMKTNVFWENRLADVLLSLTWPVIDTAATAKTNHCTKSMFSLHAKTGRVAVPVNQLFASTSYAVPPVVVPDQIGVRGSDSSKRFQEGIALIESAHRRVARINQPSLGIEDLAPPPKKMCF